MSVNDSQWLCTLCNKTFDVAPGIAEDERRCPYCMRRTGLVPSGQAAGVKDSRPSAVGTLPAKRGPWPWKWLVAAVTLAAAGAGGWWGWSLWSTPGPKDQFESLVSNADLGLLFDVKADDPRLEKCDSLEGFRGLMEASGLLGGTPDNTLRSAQLLLDGGSGATPAEGLVIGLACIRAHGEFALPCRPGNPDLSLAMEKQPVGLCAVKDGKVEEAVMLPLGTETALEEMELVGTTGGAAWLLATLGSLATTPSDAYRLFGAALEAWDDPLIRFQLGEAKLRFKVPDFASEDMARALASGYNEQGAIRLAEVQSKMGRWGEALGLYQKVLQEGSTSTVAVLGKVKSLLALGRMAEAEPLLNDLSKKSPDLEGLNHVLAAWHLANKRPEEALSALRKELDTRPSVSAALAWVRTLESVKGADEAAKAIGTIPVQGVELDLEGMRLLLVQGKKSESAESARRLVAKYPTDHNVMRACGLAFFDSGDLAAAEKAFDAADRFGEGKEFESLTYLTLVRYLLESKGQAVAESGAATLKRLEGRHPNALLDIALSLNGLGLWAKARELLEQKLASDPVRKIDIAVNLYGLYLRNGDPAKADELRKRILSELSEAERPGVEAGFQHELESVREPEDTPSSASTPQPANKSRPIDPKKEMK